MNTLQELPGSSICNFMRHYGCWCVTGCINSLNTKVQPTQTLPCFGKTSGTLKNPQTYTAPKQHISGTFVNLSLHSFDELGVHSSWLGALDGHRPTVGTVVPGNWPFHSPNTKNSASRWCFASTNCINIRVVLLGSLCLPLSYTQAGNFKGIWYFLQLKEASRIIPSQILKAKMCLLDCFEFLMHQ